MQAHPTRRRVIVGAVSLRGVERRGDCRTAAAQVGCRQCPSPGRRRTHPPGIARANATLLRELLNQTAEKLK